MSMVEQIDDNNGGNLEYGEYDKILDSLDFLSEEGDEKDWDSQDFGPLFDDFIGLFPSNINNEDVSKVPSSNPNALISVNSEQKELEDCVVIANNTPDKNGANTSHQNVISPGSSPISVLESGGTCSSGKSLTTNIGMDIPVRARSKRERPSNGGCPWLRNTPISSAASEKSSYSIDEKKRPRTNELQQDIKTSPEDLTHTEKKVTSKQRSVVSRRCSHCHVTKTPQWREGPLGRNTLCNACGVRYRTGRLFPEYRPAASPTFTPSLHSNSHRKVVEMREKAIQETVPVLLANPMSSFSESVPMNSYLFDDSMLYEW